MKRRYFVQTFDEQTDEPGWSGIIEEESFDDAKQEGQRQGAMHVGHPRVRVTEVVELDRETRTEPLFGETRRPIAA